MGEFRIGRKFAQHSYPDAPRGAAAALLARNFAFGPATTTDIETSPTAIPWEGVDVGAPGITAQITPRVSGIVLISAVVAIKSLSGVQEIVTVDVSVNGFVLNVPFFNQITVEAGGFLVVPILTETNVATLGALLPIGVPATVSILLTANTDDVLQLSTDDSSISIQEVLPATG